MTPRRNVLARSALVGGLATLVDLVALFALVSFLGIAPVWANVPALTLGLAVQFFGNKYFAFGDTSRDFVRQGAWFAAIEVGAFALNAAAFHVLVVLLGVPYLLGRIIGSALVYFGFSYPLWGRVFTPRANGA